MTWVRSARPRPRPGPTTSPGIAQSASGNCRCCAPRSTSARHMSRRPGSPRLSGSSVSKAARSRSRSAAGRVSTWATRSSQRPGPLPASSTIRVTISETPANSSAHVIVCGGTRAHVRHRGWYDRERMVRRVGRIARSNRQAAAGERSRSPSRTSRRRASGRDVCGPYRSNTLARLPAGRGWMLASGVRVDLSQARERARCSAHVRGDQARASSAQTRRMCGDEVPNVDPIRRRGRASAEGAGHRRGRPRRRRGRHPAPPRRAADTSARDCQARPWHRRWRAR